MQAIGPPAPPTGYIPSVEGLPRAASRGDGSCLWLVRHAEVAERWHDMAYGSMDVELSESGLAATRDMAAAFALIPIDEVLSSDLQRARRMGAGIAQATGAPITLTKALREMHRGAWQGLSKAEFVQNWVAQAQLYWSDPFRWHTPDGEGDEKLFARAWPVVESALESRSGGRFAITAHGQLIRVLISRILGVSVPESYEYYLDPAHATCLIDAPEGWRIEARNQSPREVHERFHS